MPQYRLKCNISLLTLNIDFIVALQSSDNAKKHYKYKMTYCNRIVNVTRGDLHVCGNYCRLMKTFVRSTVSPVLTSRTHQNEFVIYFYSFIILSFW